MAIASFQPFDPQPILLLLAMLQGAMAALIARLQRAPPWWLFIHLAFAPLAIAVQGWQIEPYWYLLGFLALLAVFWRTDRSQVPLYLSNPTTAQTLLALLPETPCRLIDLGCGTGALLRRLAAARPDCTFVGIEHAPLPWLIARLLNGNHRPVQIRYGNFWQIPLADYDVVYAFLSPAPMARLWQKAACELSPHAQLISNSFAIPDIAPAAIIDVADRRRTRLLIYRPTQSVPPHPT